jgi:hypothetical protein
MFKQLVIRMDEHMVKLMKKLANKNVMERLDAIEEIRHEIDIQKHSLAELYLSYVSDHDPSYAVRGKASQLIPTKKAPANWEKTHLFFG